MGLFDRVPTNFKPGNLFQLGRGSKLVPAGTSPASGSLLQYNATTGNWIATPSAFPLPSTAGEGDMLRFSGGNWVLLANPAAGSNVLITGGSPLFTPSWVAKVSPSAIGLTTNGDLVTQASGVLDRIAVGAASTVLRGGSAPTYGTIDNTFIDNRTRKLPLYPEAGITGSAFTSAPVEDAGAIGAIGANGQWHTTVVDGGTLAIEYKAFVLPADYVSGGAIVTSFASSAAGNNVAMNHQCYSVPAQDATALSTMLATGTVARAANATANKTQKLTVAFTGSPAADDLVFCSILFIRGDASDTNTGTVYVVGSWFEYTADM